VRVWAIEGAGHYGAGRTRYLSGRGESVIETGRGAGADRRLRGKDDPLDAIRAARSALATEMLTLPRSGQHQEALRVLLLARRSAVDVRRLALVQLRSVLVTAPERLRTRDPSARPGSRAEAPRRARCWPDRRSATDRYLVASRPRPLRSRLRPLAGVAPLPASSGLTTRHRLSRGGDRQLNRALHTVILHHRQHDPATRDYIARRVAEGKSAREATRVLKRYLARHLYRVMQTATPLMT
jgi:transposase